MPSRGVCAVCQREVGLSVRGKPVFHGEDCPGRNFPHLGESLVGLTWAIDRAAADIAGIRDELAIHWTRPALRAIADLLSAHGVPIPDLGVNWSSQVDSTWDKRQAELTESLASLQRDLDRLVTVLNEWQPADSGATRPVIHRRALWRAKPGTEVPLCWSDAIRRPSGNLLMEDDPGRVSCRDCQLFHQRPRALSK